MTQHEACNFADYTTFYVYDKDLNIFINRLEHDTALTFVWFENNFMKLNQDKCQLLVSGHKLFRLKEVKQRSGKATNKNCLVLLLIEI